MQRDKAELQIAQGRIFNTRAAVDRLSQKGMRDLRCSFRKFWEAAAQMIAKRAHFSGAVTI